MVPCFHICTPDVLRIADNVCWLSVSIVRLLDRYKVRYAHVLKHLDISEPGALVRQIHADRGDTGVSDGAE